MLGTLYLTLVSQLDKKVVPSSLSHSEDVNTGHWSGKMLRCFLICKVRWACYCTAIVRTMHTYYINPFS